MYELPPGPDKTTSELSEMFKSNPFPFLKECFSRYGDKFTLELGNFGINDFKTNNKWVFISAEEDIKTLYKTSASVLSAGAANQIQFAQLLPSDGSAMLDGEKHLERRKMLGNLLQNKEKIRSFTTVINRVIDEEIEKLSANEYFSLALIFHRFTAEVVRHLNFGPDENEKARKISQNLARLNEPNASGINPFEIVAECTNIVDDIINDYKRCPHSGAIEGNRILATLMDEAAQGKLSESEVRSELIVMLVGGSDTTAITMQWVMAWILAFPQVYEKVQEEIISILGDKLPQADDLDKLTYLDAVIWEACRLSPMLFTTAARLLMKPLAMGKYVIPPGTIVVVCTHLTHINPENYDKPLEFMPERFLGINPDPYKMAHFGGGIRRCIGMAFALYEIKAGIARLLQTTKLEPVEPSTAPEMRGVFYCPQGGVKVKIKS